MSISISSSSSSSSVSKSMNIRINFDISIIPRTVRFGVLSWTKGTRWAGWWHADRSWGPAEPDEWHTDRSWGPAGGRMGVPA